MKTDVADFNVTVINELDETNQASILFASLEADIGYKIILSISHVAPMIRHIAKIIPDSC